MSRRLAAAAAVTAACAAATYAGLPPRARTLNASPGVQAAVRGVLHVHSVRSDGSGTPDQIASAARRAGLQFVILTDHGNGARQPELPAYRDGVLSIDAVEISTEGGHLVALGLGRAPYPLGGEPRDVVVDVARLGGVSIAAHPDSAKQDLRWTDWRPQVDGLEWLNGDSEWRDERASTISRVLLSYLFRPPETLGLMLDRPAETLRRWDDLLRVRRVVAVAATDAHARVGTRPAAEWRSPLGALPIPGYEQIFRTMSLSLPGVRLTGDAAVDARHVVNAIRQGHVYSTADALASPAALSFVASSGGTTVQGGDVLPLDGPISLTVETNVPSGGRVVLFRDGQPVAQSAGPALHHQAAPVRAVYRVEVELPGSSEGAGVPWLVSNPVYAGFAAAESQVEHPVRRVPTAFATLYADGPPTEWTVEKNPRSQGAIDVVGALGGDQLLLRYALGGGEADHPYVAFVVPARPAPAEFDRLTFSARAGAPARLSVQLRVPGDGDGQRWHRSVYLDSEPREISVMFDDMRPRGTTGQARAPLGDVHAILFVVDAVNTAAGSNGQIWIDNIRFGR